MKSHKIIKAELKTNENKVHIIILCLFHQTTSSGDSAEVVKIANTAVTKTSHPRGVSKSAYLHTVSWKRLILVFIYRLLWVLASASCILD